MYIGIKHLHSLVASILLILVILSVVYFIYGWLGRKSFTRGSEMIAKVGLTAIRVQVVVGLVLYFVSPLGVSNFSKEIMGNSVGRLYALEHPLVMLLGTALITIGYTKATKNDEPVQKYRLLSLFYLSGLVLILSGIPWHVWL